MIVGLGHIHSALESIFVLVAVILATNKLISFVVSLVLSGVFKARFYEAIRFATGHYLGLLTRKILGSLFLEGG